MKITKFRAIDESTNDFVYGSLIQTTDPDVAYIIEPIDDVSKLSDIGKRHKINPSTVSQFTNKSDRNKVNIYSGDVIVVSIKTMIDEMDPKPFNGYCLGVAEIMSSGIIINKYVLHSNGNEPYNDVVISTPKIVPASKSTVIGNIYKPECIKEKYKKLFEKLSIK